MGEKNIVTESEKGGGERERDRTEWVNAESRTIT